MSKLKLLKYSIASIFLASTLSAEVQTTSTDIEANKLKQELKKEIELINMIESYVLLNAPNDGTKFDITLLNRQKIQEFYNLPSSFFKNYSGETCTITNPALDLCANDTSGIYLDIQDEYITIGNLIGNKINERSRNIFKRMHKKYKSVMFGAAFDSFGSISRTIPTKIRTLKRNLNLYLKNPYPNSHIGYGFPVLPGTSNPDISKTWVRPDGDGGFNTYAYNMMTSSWELLSKNVVSKYPTYGRYSDLEAVNSFNGAVMYSRYSNDESDYSKYGEMEFINTGKYGTTNQERWSIKAANDMFITDVINLTNSCTEQKNPLIGVDADSLLNFKTSSTEETIGETISINSTSTDTTINARQMMIKFRDKYEFVLDPSDPTSNVKFDYRDSNSLMTSWSADIEAGSKTLKHNTIRFNVYNKISNTFDSIKEIKINKVKFYNPNFGTWSEFTPTNNVITNQNEIKLTFNSIDNNVMDNIGVSKYSATGLPSGTTYAIPVPDYKFESSVYGNWYGDIDNATFDGNIDKIKGFPMLVDFSLKVNSKCDGGKNFHDCYIVETSTHGCFISKLKSVTITK